MTGPEHYREAERLLEQAEVDSRDPMRKYAEDANLIAAAQVHATLAQVAATVNVSAEDAPLAPAPSGWEAPIGDRLTWAEVTG